jgi:hypothetical protein
MIVPVNIFPEMKKHLKYTNDGLSPILFIPFKWCGISEDS